MNIGLVSEEYPPDPASGGIGTHFHALAQGFAARGHCVHVISTARDGCDQHTLDGEVQLHRLATHRFPASSALRRRGLPTTMPLARALRVATAIARLERHLPFDVLEAPNWGAEALLYTLRPRAPLVVRIVTPLAVVEGDQQGWLSRPGVRLRAALERMEVRRASHLICSSQYIAGVAQRLYGVDTGRISVIQLGLAPPRSDSEPTSAADTTGAVVLYVGRLEQRKGVRYLLEAIPAVVAAVPGVRFRLVGRNRADAPGDISYQAYFDSLASPQARKATTFVGYVDEQALEREYANCSVFAAPSLFESFGLIHLEAMARGKPVVACASAATPELVVDGHTGLLAPPQDSDALARALITLLRQPEAAQRMGQQGRLRALSHFSVEKLVDGTLAVYQDVREQWSRSNPIRGGVQANLKSR